MNRKKLIIILTGALVIVGVGIGIVSNSIFRKDALPTTETEEEIVEKENEKIQETLDIPDEQINDLTDKDRAELVNKDPGNLHESVDIIKDDKNKEYPLEKSNDLIKKFIEYCEVASYDKIVKEMQELIQKYNFTTDRNLELVEIYKDATLFMNTLSQTLEMKGQIVRDMRNPEMLMISTLMLPEEARREVIEDINSLTPIFDGSVKISNHKEYKDLTKEDEKDPILVSAFNSIDSTKSVHKADVIIENKLLNAYVVEDLVGSLTLYGYYGVDGNNYHFKTVEFFTKLDEKMNKKYQ